MEIKEIQKKLYDKLKGSGWDHKLKMFLLSKEFENILTELYKKSTSGDKFTPTLKQLFRAFEVCKYENLKVVMLSGNPYAMEGVSDGLAFSCSNPKKEEGTLRLIFKEIENTVAKDGTVWNPDLTRWSEQGILLLNTSMTTNIIGDSNHFELWQPFYTYLFDMLNSYNSGIIYVFMGKQAKSLHKQIVSNNYKFFITHPASAAYFKNGTWDSNDLFNGINNILYKNYGEKIKW